MTNEQNRNLAIFYCQHVPESNEQIRQDLEKKYGSTLRLFPIPCSGRLESLHLLKALETFADAAFVITCPEGTCRYFEGNQWAKKRVKKAQEIIQDIGLEKERLDIIIGSINGRKTLAELSEEIAGRAARLRPSPVHRKAQGVRRKAQGSRRRDIEKIVTGE